MEYMTKLKDSIEQATVMNINGVDYVVKSEISGYVSDAESFAKLEAQTQQFVPTTGSVTGNIDWKPNINCDEQDSFIRSHSKPRDIVIACIIPFIVHIALCTITQLTNLNFEGVTGGVTRAATGTLAIMGIFALALFILTKYVVRILYVRYTVSSCEQFPAYDGITDYKQLTSWQRLKCDLVIIFGLLLSFSILFIGQLLGFLQIPTTNLNP